MKQCIAINRKSLRLRLCDSPSPDELAIPVDDFQSHTALPLLLLRAIKDIYLFTPTAARGPQNPPLEQARDMQARLPFPGSPGGLFIPPPPPPWLVALAAMMWEGLVQGATWAVVRRACDRAINLLRRHSLAPQELPVPGWEVLFRRKLSHDELVEELWVAVRRHHKSAGAEARTLKLTLDEVDSAAPNRPLQPTTRARRKAKSKRRSRAARG